MENCIMPFSANSLAGAFCQPIAVVPFRRCYHVLLPLFAFTYLCYFLFAVGSLEHGPNLGAAIR